MVLLPPCDVGVAVRVVAPCEAIGVEVDIACVCARYSEWEYRIGPFKYLRNTVWGDSCAGTREMSESYGPLRLVDYRTVSLHV